MRFEVANLVDSATQTVEIPWRDSDGTHFLDLRADAAAIAHIPSARENPPLAALLVALNGDRSIFRTIRARVWSDLGPATPQEGNSSSFQSFIDFAFADVKLNTADQQQDVVRRLLDLWMKEPSTESFAARLEVLPFRSEGAPGNAAALRLVLIARGATVEQARMRWGLGVVKIQQSLLFVSRALRQKLGLADSPG